MTIETGLVTGAAYWASYLVNGDASGLEPEEKALADAWLERLGEGVRVVDVERDEDGEACEARFSWSYGLHTGADVSGGDLLDYVTHHRKGD